jgi:triosephosphate isomerase (TIM)
MSRRVVAGNWKMNLGPAEGRRFVEQLELTAGASGEVEVILFPPALTVSSVAKALASRQDLSVELGVQNVHHEPSGAYTGELSAGMASEAGAGYVLVGHSERRHLFGETDEDARRKVLAVLEAGMVPVLCVGETLEERRAGRVEEVILRQLEEVVLTPAIRTHLQGGSRFMVAYEPVWAIGTGETATPEDASQAHGVLRERLARVLDGTAAGGVPLLYGGSVKPGNAGELLSASEVDGVLVGGASLDPTSFAGIVAAAG